MGMFDYIQWNARLPVPRDSFVRQRMNPAQSKSIRLWEKPEWECEAYEYGCLTITVSEDGTMLDPKGDPLRWTGDLYFYGGKRDEFQAQFENGKLLNVRKADT